MQTPADSAFGDGLVAAMYSLVDSPLDEPPAASPPPDNPEPVEQSKKPTMAEKIAAEQEADPLSHTWVAAATLAIDFATARRASFRGSFRAEGGMRVDALEVYCGGCRRPLDEVRDEPCAAKIDNTHLIGGNPGERAKRKVYEVKGVIKRQVIDRRGRDGYSVHASNGR